MCQTGREKQGEAEQLHGHLGDLDDLGVLGDLGDLDDLGHLGDLDDLGDLGDQGDIDDLYDLSDLCGTDQQLLNESLAPSPFVEKKTYNFSKSATFIPDSFSNNKLTIKDFIKSCEEKIIIPML